MCSIPEIISSNVSNPSSLLPVIQVIEFFFADKFILNNFGKYFDSENRFSILKISSVSFFSLFISNVFSLNEKLFDKLPFFIYMILSHKFAHFQ